MSLAVEVCGISCEASKAAVLAFPWLQADRLAIAVLARRADSLTTIKIADPCAIAGPG